MTHKAADKAGAGSALHLGSGSIRTGLVVCLLAVAAAAGIALAPYVFRGASLESEVARQVRTTTGLILAFDRPARFSLWPRPHVSTDALHVSDPTGTLAIDAEALEGEVRLLPLIVGRIEMSAATLSRPRLAIDLDGSAMLPDSLIGRALRNEDDPNDGSQRLGIVTLVDGVASIKSKAFPNTPQFRRVNVTLDWRDLDSPATLTGSLMVRDTAAEIAAWIAQPSNLMRGDQSAVAFHVRGVPLDLSASGDLTTAAATTFHGHMSAKAPAMTDLLRLVGEDRPLLAPFSNLVLDSDVGIAIGAHDSMNVDLSKLVLRTDGNDYEGTLALQGGVSPAISGTLATEQLNVAPFLSRLPALVDGHRRWSTAPLLDRPTQPLDLDLRISATRLRLAPITVDDAALSIMTRGDRTEVALVEGKAYGGTIKGRISVGGQGRELNLRGTGSVTDADFSALGWDVVGRQVATGALTVTATVESNGETTAELMKRLHGTVKGALGDGEITGVDIGHALRELNGKNTAGSDAVSLALRSGRTPFSQLTFAAEIDDGVAVVDESTVRGPDATMAIGGSMDIGQRTFDLQVVSSTPSADKTAPQLRLEIEGPFDRPNATRK